MSTPFDPHRGVILIFARLEGPTGEYLARLALDTGATVTTIQTAVLVAIGYDPAASVDRLSMTTGSGVEYVPRLPIRRIEALGRERADFPVVAHTLPPSATVDGLLGLNYMRGHVLMVDFPRGVVTLA